MSCVLAHLPNPASVLFIRRKLVMLLSYLLCSYEAWEGGQWYIGVGLIVAHLVEYIGHGQEAYRDAAQQGVPGADP